MVRTVAVLAAIALLGCRDSTAVLTSRAVFDVDTREYLQGQPLTAHLTNGTPYHLDVGLCVATLQRREGAGWTTITQTFPPNRVCVASAMVLVPGARMPYHATVPSDLAPGTYRLATHAGLRSIRSAVTLTTSSFVVRAP